MLDVFSLTSEMHLHSPRFEMRLQSSQLPKRPVEPLDVLTVCVIVWMFDVFPPLT